MPLELTNIKLIGASALVNTVSDNPILLSTDLAGRIEIADRIRVEPEVGDWQIIAGQPKVWDGAKWIDRGRHASYDPISFVPRNGDDVWTVYPGWQAMKGQMIYCHRCFAAAVSMEGNMDGWWVRPNHMETITCNVCGVRLGQHLGERHFSAFVRKARKT